MKVNIEYKRVVPAVIVFIFYLPVLTHQFLQYDVLLLESLSVFAIPERWLLILGESTIFSPNHFRPLSQLLLLIQLQLGSGEALIFRLLQIGFHIASTTLVVLITERLMEGKKNSQGSWLPGMVGLIYGLHPVLIGGIAEVTSQSILLMSTLLLLGLYVDLSIEHPGQRSFAISILAFLAALSHEYALGFFLFLPLWHIAVRNISFTPLREYLRKVRDSGDLLSYGGVLFSTLGTLAIRYASFGYLYAVPSADSGNVLQRILLVSRSFIEYLFVVVWPAGLVRPVHYRSIPPALTDIASWLALVLFVLIVIGIGLLAKKYRISGWLLIAAMVMVLLISQIFPLELPGNMLIAEQLLLFPLAIMIMAAIPLLEPLLSWFTSKSREMHWGNLISVSWLFILLVSLQLALPKWHDNLTYWIWAVERTPNAPLGYLNLAREFLSQGDFTQALTVADGAIDLDVEEADAWNLAGVALLSLERIEEAVEAFEAATTLQPGNALFWNNLAAAYRDRGEYEQAAQVLTEKSLQINPNLDLAYLNLAEIHLRAGRPDLALEVLADAENRFPELDMRAILERTSDPTQWLQYGEDVLEEDPSAALAAFDRAFEFGADPVEVAVRKSAALMHLGNWEEATDVLLRALQMNANEPRLINNLGVVAREMGDLEAARAFFERAILLAPDWQVPQENLQALDPGEAGGSGGP